jgi:glutaredoxin
MKTPRTLTRSLSASTLLLLALSAQAQTVYKIVGPDGKITFSDKPPAADKGKIAGTGTGASGAASAASDLPFELRQVTAKYPVTLYTSPQCAPCDSARSLLKGRGVPVTEKTVTTTEDSAAFQRISGEGTFPFATVGTQHIKGFSASDWTQYLDAAGYPKTSLLPASYKFATATPLVAIQKSAPIPKETPKPEVDAPPPAPTTSPSNPAGITF